MGRKPYLYKKKAATSRDQSAFFKRESDLFTDLELWKLLRDRHGSVLAEIMMRVKTEDRFLEYCVEHRIFFTGLETQAQRMLNGLAKVCSPPSDTPD